MCERLTTFPRLRSPLGWTVGRRRYWLHGCAIVTNRQQTNSCPKVTAVCMTTPRIESSLGLSPTRRPPGPYKTHWRCTVGGRHHSDRPYSRINTRRRQSLGFLCFRSLAHYFPLNVVVQQSPVDYTQQSSRTNPHARLPRTSSSRLEHYLRITSDQGNLTRGRTAVTHGSFSSIRQVAPMCTTIQYKSLLSYSISIGSAASAGQPCVQVRQIDRPWNVWHL